MYVVPKKSGLVSRMQPTTHHPHQATGQQSHVMVHVASELQMSPLIVGTLKDGCVPNVPLPRVPVPLPRVLPQIQSASPTTSRESIAPKAGIPLPGYLHVPS